VSLYTAHGPEAFRRYQRCVGDLLNHISVTGGGALPGQPSRVPLGD
jgi:hypothetical protein